MFLNSLFLSISSSIDSLGIGITYGIKNTKISLTAKFILFIFSFVISSIAIFFGNVIKNIFSETFTNLIGSLILIFIGIFLLFQSIHNSKKNEVVNIKTNNEKKIYSFFIKFLGITIKIIKDPNYSDLDKSNTIDSKEALLLGLALSLDSFCIGIGGSILGINSILFPILVSIFQLIFLSIGNLIGRKLHKHSKLPDNIWSILSGVLIIIIGVFKLF